LERKRLTGKNAIITGAAGGIAKAAAISFADEGANVAMVDIDRAGVSETAEKVAAKGVKAKAFIADVTSRDAVEHMVAEAHAFMGGMDILVTCAGGYHAYANFEDIDEDDWDRVIGLNLKSVYLCCKAAIPYMKAKRWGRIINLGSLAGRTTSAGSSPAHYGSAKAAVSILTQYIAKDVGPFGITANTIAPGTTLTERVDNLLTPEKREMFTKQCPLGYLAQPDDISDVITFLASDESRYITGATIDVNGGRMMLV
jgi:NAD(P)-dependent dehydrogenase (short-subunit alcohol dehydrogenase family)